MRARTSNAAEDFDLRKITNKRVQILCSESSNSINSNRKLNMRYPCGSPSNPACCCNIILTWKFGRSRYALAKQGRQCLLAFIIGRIQRFRFSIDG